MGRVVGCAAPHTIEQRCTFGFVLASSAPITRKRPGRAGALGTERRKSRKTSEGNEAEALLQGPAQVLSPDDSHETPNPVTRQIMAPEAGLILPPPPPPRDELGGGGPFLPGQGPEPAGNSGRPGSHSPSSLALCKASQPRYRQPAPPLTSLETVLNGTLCKS